MLREKLAIFGGKPVRTKPFPARIIFDAREKEAVLKVIEKTMQGEEAIDLFGEGPEVTAYRKEFAELHGAKFAAATSSGTAAIHSAIGALRLEPCSEIITTPVTDQGTIAPILMANCIPVFADIDYDTLNISPESIEKKITKRTKVIIPVHLAGQPCDMDAIMKIARKYKLWVIEDCAQAHATKYKGKYAGTIGHMGTFSLMAGKHTTSGGQGGMVLAKDDKLYWNIKRFADRGKPFNSNEKTNLFMGLNYRMTELEASIGRVQLKKLKDIVRKRRLIAKIIENGLKDSKLLKSRKIIPGADCSYFLNFICYDTTRANFSIHKFIEYLRSEGIGVSTDYHVVMYDQYWLKNRQTYGNSRCPWSCPNYKVKIDYTNCCPNAKKAMGNYIYFKTHERWTPKDAEDMVKGFKKVEQYLMGAN